MKKHTITNITLMTLIALFGILIMQLSSFDRPPPQSNNRIAKPPTVRHHIAQPPEANFFIKLAQAAETRTTHTIRYDPTYRVIEYPGGDVPPDTGVCTDVVIRSYRAMKIDLQVKVHEDMTSNFKKYPKNWSLRKPDPNIDHRRVPNLMTFFTRHGIDLPRTVKATDYKPGDIVTWDLGGGITHIGIVVTQQQSGRNMIAHNIGAGPKLEDVLFNWKITGHYRYRGAKE